MMSRMAAGLFAGIALGSLLAGHIAKGIVVATIGGLIANAEEIRDLGRDLVR
jgi:hypothetical protein